MSEFAPIYRGSVNAWECDVMGHLNLQFYAAKLSEGLGHLSHALGLAPDQAAQLRSRHAFSRYLGELHAGAVLDIRAAVLAVDSDSIDILAEIVNAESRKVSASFELRFDNFDPVTQTSMPWSDEAHRHMTAMITERSDNPRPATAGGPVPAYSGTLTGPFVSSRGTVDSWNCDGLGRMSFQLYYGIASDGIGTVRHRMGITRDVSKRNQWGGAALEYDVRFHTPISAGDIYSLRTGLMDLGDKTFRVGHQFHNDSSGELAASFDIVACMFDLKARRAMTIPDDIRAQAETLMIPWPPE